MPKFVVRNVNCKNIFLNTICEGLVAHRHMHERAGDVARSRIKQNFKVPSRLAVQSKPIDRLERPCAKPHRFAPILERKNSQKINEPSKKIAPPSPSTQHGVMTRRFTIAEKLRIIDKFNETKNVSGTAHWVREEFNRSTFARKSLHQMLSREDVYRAASGTKRKRKTVRPRTGMFHRMEKELAS